MIKTDEKDLKELIIKLKNGEKSSFEELYTKYNKLVYRIAFSILKNKTDSEDVVQIVFAKLYELDKNKLPTNKEISWLYTVTKNEALAIIKKKRNSIDLESIYEVEDKNNEINSIIDEESYNSLINGLSNKEKEIISLKILASLSFKEIGKLLNEPIGTIKWRYYKSIHTLKLALSNLGMAIIAFVVGLSGRSNKNVPKENNHEILENENVSENDIANSQMKGDSQEDIDSSFYEEFLENEKKQETIVQEPAKENNINYFRIGMLSVSALFLILTITFLIIFIKHQLKAKKKTSK